MNYSHYIDRLEAWLTSCGVKVHLHAHELGSAGLYRSETREIFLNEPSARAALMTLAHEAGHWLGYTCFGERPHSYQRERQAFVYGYRVLRLIGADLLISRWEWIENELAAGNVLMLQRRDTPTRKDPLMPRTHPNYPGPLNLSRVEALFLDTLLAQYAGAARRLTPRNAEEEASLRAAMEGHPNIAERILDKLADALKL